MIIHIVEQGETIYSIANLYGVSAERLMLNNSITDPENLLIGETLVIAYPEQTHIVQEGDTLLGIAQSYGISINDLLRNNPYLSDREYIYPGEELVISYMDEKIMEVSINGYAFPFIDTSLLEKTLPFLTYLTIFQYYVSPDGSLSDIDDTAIIQLAKVYGVAPIMMVSNLADDGSFDANVIRTILLDRQVQTRLINNILAILNTKGYYGLTIDFPYVNPEERDEYLRFITEITDVVNSQGYIINVTLSPDTFELESGYIFQGFDYAGLGSVADGTILISYEWGYTYGPTVDMIPFDQIEDILEYAVTQIPSRKISIGIPSVGYRWRLPYVEGVTRADSITYRSAIELASQFGVPISYDETTETVFFQYIDVDQEEYIVWFKDARSIDARLNLMPRYNLMGTAIWNIMYFFSQMWMLINLKFDIEKVLDPIGNR